MVQSSQSPPQLRLAVIGGGIAGLAAAHRLRQLLPAAELRLFEASPRVGGPLYSEHRDDLLLEHGADSFIAKTPWAVELCRELGLAGELCPTNAENRRAMVVRGGTLQPVPDGFVLMQPRSRAGVMRSPVLSLRGKMRVLAEPWIASCKTAGEPGYDESVASFAIRRLGREAFERLVEPLVAGIYVADADQLSLAATMPEFLEAEQVHGSMWRALQAAKINGDRASQTAPPATESENKIAGARYDAFLTLRRGMGALVDALVGSMPAESVLTSAPISELVKSASRWLVVADNQAVAAEFDGVILAPPAYAAARIVQRFDQQLSRALGSIEYASSAVATLIYRRSDIVRPLDAFGIVVPRIESRRILAASFPSVKFPDRASERFVPIRVFLGGALHPELIDSTDVQLSSAAHEELRSLLEIRGEPVESRIARWPQSMPQYKVGHLQLVERIEHRTGLLCGVELAGNAYRGVGIPQCIRSGREAAERLAADLKSRW